MDNERLIAVIEEVNGNITAVARRLGVQRTTVYRHIEKHKTAQQALEQARETMLDNAESVLYKKVLEGSTAELIFFLKTQGRNRGYVERQEVTGKDGGDIVLRVVYDGTDGQTS